MVMRIAMRDPQRFAGAISLGGYMPSTGTCDPRYERSARASFSDVVAVGSG